MVKQEKFSCPYCGLRYDAQSEWAGQRAKCKCCRNLFIVPGTLLAGQDLLLRNARTSADEGTLLPEAKVVSESPGEASLPEARLVIDSEGELSLEPIAAMKITSSVMEAALASEEVPRFRRRSVISRLVGLFRK